MSTATVGAPVLPAITTDKRSYSVVQIDWGKDKEGKDNVDYKVLSEEDAAELVKEPPKKNDVTAKVEVVMGPQTFDFDHGNTLDGLRELFTTKDADGKDYVNEKELCKQTNNAVDIKLGNKVRQLMLANNDDGEFTFEPQEGSISLREYIGVETSSRGKSQLEKTLTIASKLPPDQMAQLLEFLKAQAAQQ